MKYLSRDTQANVSILLVVMRWLAASLPMTYTELASAVRPPSVAPEADNALRATLDVGKHVGLLEAGDPDGEWAIANRDDALVASLGSHESFRLLVRQALLDKAVNDREAGAAPSDVALGLAWLCTLDPSRPLAWGWDDGPEATVRSAGLGDVINGKTQWGAFRRWATALGFGTSSRPARNRLHRLIPDPTVAIADCLSSMPQSLSAQEFVALLARRLPAIDAGALEAPLRDLGVRYEARGEATLGPATGHALERLHRRGALQLEKSDDARNRVSYRVGGQARTFDFVTIETAADA